MRSGTLVSLVFVGLVSAAAVVRAAGPAAVSKDEAVQWIRYTVPLPKQIEITAKVAVPAGDVAIVVPAEAPPLALQGRKELLECLGLPENAATPDKPSFTITMRLGGDEAAGLREYRNADQAYFILPAADGRGLRLVALAPHGLYYAAKTLRQLVRAKVTGDRAEMPILRVTDWPDMADRGLWGGDSSLQLRWMSDRKMNYDEQISHAGIDEDKRCFVQYPPYKQKMIDEGPTYGINPVPVILHLEQLAGSGLFRVYPELQGRGAKVGAICYSNPLFADILAQWLLLWRSKPGVTEVDVWMTENLAGEKGCQCERCAKEDRSVLEARAIVAAWKKALEKEPNLGLRVLTSEETEKSNPRVFAELPPAVKIWYYHSLYTYNSSRAPMIRRYLVDTVHQGRWLGVCPNLCALVGFWQPFTGAAFTHARMNEFVDKGLSGLLGYAVPCIRHVAFNTEAAAEWTWNAKGRTPHEFALSWAVREGIKDPAKFAEWSDIHGQVAWDVYGSEYPSGEQRGHPGQAATMLKEGKLPELGFVLWEIYGYPWGEIKNVEQLERDVTRAARSVQLAREIGEPVFVQESLVVQGYVHALKALWELRSLVRSGSVARADKDAARRQFQAYVDGLAQAVTALPAWEAALPMAEGDKNMVREPVKKIREMIEGMKAVAAEVGCAVK